MRDDTRLSDGLIHAGAGTAQLLAFLGLIPGFIPVLALAALITAVLVAPFVILAVAVALAAAPFYLTSRVLRRARRRRRHEESPRRTLPVPVPGPSVA